jgi:hypothetical protein
LRKASVQCLQATTLLRARRMIAPKVLFWWPDARSIEKVESIQESGQSNVVSSPLHEVEVASGRSSENCCPCALGNPTLHEEWAEVSRDRFRDEDNMLGPISRAHRHRVEEGLLEAEGKKTLRSYTITVIHASEEAKRRRGRSRIRLSERPPLPLSSLLQAHSRLSSPTAVHRHQRAFPFVTSEFVVAKPSKAAML